MFSIIQRVSLILPNEFLFYFRLQRSKGRLKSIKFVMFISSVVSSFCSHGQLFIAEHKKYKVKI